MFVGYCVGGNAGGIGVLRSSAIVRKPFRFPSASLVEAKTYARGLNPVITNSVLGIEVDNDSDIFYF